jgi:hypothetical protein
MSTTTSDTTNHNIKIISLTNEITFTFLEASHLRQQTVGYYLYDASIILSQWLLINEHKLPQNKINTTTVIELGAGVTGLVGLTLAKILQYPNIIWTDLEINLSCLQKNMERNGISSPTIKELNWNNPSSFDSMMKSDNNNNVLIVGSDLIYMKRDCEPLLNTLFHLMYWGETTDTIKKKCQAFLCCEKREEGLIEYFISLATEKNFIVKIIKLKRKEFTCMNQIDLNHFVLLNVILV